MRFRHWREAKKARTDRFRYWLYFKSWKWIFAVFVAYMVTSWEIGFVNAWEILVGRVSAKSAAWPWASWPLSIFGWLLVPAFIGGVAGYVVTEQITSRRTDSPAEATAELADQSQWPEPPRHGDPQ
ncbi:DUF6313 family protein [Streptomyces sp. B21-079]|uniref:DUF6313 family protein n=1 Tax=Streptomyces sp. B21-079 TaxID=3039409 RepID=UPI002FF2633A